LPLQFVHMSSGKKLIVQIVPALSPPANGVGDYAVEVARALKQGFDTETVFVLGSPPTREPGFKNEFQFASIVERSASGVRRALDQVMEINSTQNVLLQLSAYGFDGNGSPRWLARGLAQWVAQDCTRHRLITMFHELYASGPPWTRAFWLSGLQKRTARAIFESSRAALTGVPRIAWHLQKWNEIGERSVTCLPVPSAVGEPESVVAITQRRRRICVFGRSPGSSPLPNQMNGLLRAIVDQWQIEEVAVVGESPVTEPLADVGCQVRAYAAQSPEEIGKILMQSVLGLSWYPPMALGKSSVFAAYCAYGVPTLMVGQFSGEDQVFEGLNPDIHYFSASGMSRQWVPEMLQRISDNARSWYAGHSVREHARLVAQLLANTP
ncbi:MAG: hypothetical protein ACT4P8_22000, partial [Betaproteobacteria bacterium]